MVRVSIRPNKSLQATPKSGAPELERSPFASLRENAELSRELLVSLRSASGEQGVQDRYAPTGLRLNSALSIWGLKQWNSMLITMDSDGLRILTCLARAK